MEPPLSHQIDYYYFPFKRKQLHNFRTDVKFEISSDPILKGTATI